MVKRKAKKGLKQKQKQNVNVKQNVKVVVGDVKKRKQVRKASGAKAGASVKPPIVLNISNPQPLNNAYFEYFKNQLQNQEPIKATTLKQHEILNEREETKASKAGALHKLDQEPGADVKRELTRQAAETRLAIEESNNEKSNEEREIQNSLKTPKTNKKRAPKRKTVLKLVETPEERENPFMHLLSASETEAEEVGAGAGAGATPQMPSLARQSSMRGRKASDLYTPQEGDTKNSLLEMLSQLTEEELDKKLTGAKLKSYMKRLELPNRERGSTNPLSAPNQRIAIMGLIQSYKRDRGMIK